MKKNKFVIVSPCFSHLFRVLINKTYHYYYVIVDRDMEEAGTWQCEVFVRHFFSCGYIELMDHVHSERISRTSTAASWSVAREALRHYLYDKFSNDDFPF